MIDFLKVFVWIAAPGDIIALISTSDRPPSTGPRDMLVQDGFGASVGGGAGRVCGACRAPEIRSQMPFRLIRTQPDSYQGRGKFKCFFNGLKLLRRWSI